MPAAHRDAVRGAREPDAGGQRPGPPAAGARGPRALRDPGRPPRGAPTRRPPSARCSAGPGRSGGCRRPTAGRENDFGALLRRFGERTWRDPLADDARAALAEVPDLLAQPAARRGGARRGRRGPRAPPACWAGRATAPSARRRSVPGQLPGHRQRRPLPRLRVGLLPRRRADGAPRCACRCPSGGPARAQPAGHGRGDGGRLAGRGRAGLGRARATSRSCASACCRPRCSGCGCRPARCCPAWWASADGPSGPRRSSWPTRARTRPAVLSALWRRLGRTPSARDARRHRRARGGRRRRARAPRRARPRCRPTRRSPAAGR